MARKTSPDRFSGKFHTFPVAFGGRQALVSPSLEHLGISRKMRPFKQVLLVWGQAAVRLIQTARVITANMDKSLIIMVK